MPLLCHYCNILGKYNMLDFKSYQMFMNAIKMLNGLALPLTKCINNKNNVGVCTRAPIRGDEEQRHRTK